MKTRYYIAFLILLGLWSCKPEIEEFTPSRGDVDFSNYIAVGNSLTAGYADGALYKSGQENSYPNIVATQFKKAGGGEFKQPLMVDDYGVGFDGLQPVPKLVLGYDTDCLGNTDLAPVRADVEVNPENLLPINDQGPFNNIGVPGLRAVDALIPGYGVVNPYYGRFMSDGQNSILDEITTVNGTFFTLWLGQNDILSYATSGGVNPIVPVEDFTAAMQTIINTLTTNPDVKGAVANIPNLLDAPFFTTVPYNALVLQDPVSIDQLNAAYAPLNQQIMLAGSTDTIAFAAGPNPLVVEDATLPWGLRQLKPEDLVLLTTPSDSIKCGGWGSITPVPASFVLDASEKQEAEQAINEYNQSLTGLLNGKPVAFVDLNSKLSAAASGELVFDGITLTNEFVSGNIFSLDGLHLTPAGSAAVAYFFIEEINAKFNASVPQVIVSDYPAVTYP